MGILLSSRKRERKRATEREFFKNGSILLESLVSLCDGRPPPIRNFSYEELIQATDNFDDNHILSDFKDADKWYRGSHEGRSVSIKKYRDSNGHDDPFMDIAIFSKVSAHKNVLRLIGCCLETPIPILVTEFIASETLYDRIMSPQGESMAWQRRLKISKEMAHAIAYLHTAFHRPIIHRDIKLEYVIFDQHDVPKLSDFKLSISLPEGEIHVKANIMIGTYGCMCPEYLGTGWITEKVDVFSFGVFLLELLTGRIVSNLVKLSSDEEVSFLDFLKKKDVFTIVDPTILAEQGGVVVEQQLKDVLQLVLICIDNDPEKRPTMVDVSKELRLIEKFVI